MTSINSMSYGGVIDVKRIMQYPKMIRSLSNYESISKTIIHNYGCYFFLKRGYIN